MLSSTYHLVLDGAFDQFSGRCKYLARDKDVIPISDSASCSPARSFVADENAYRGMGEQAYILGWRWP